jgi:chaperonin GroES
MSVVTIHKHKLALDRYQPLCDFVLIERIDQTLETTESGLHIPQIAQAISNKGRVIAVGEGRIVGNQIVPIPLEPGDTVLFSKYGAEEVKLDDQDFLLIRYDEVKLKERRVALVS